MNNMVTDELLLYIGILVWVAPLAIFAYIWIRLAMDDKDDGDEDDEDDIFKMDMGQ